MTKISRMCSYFSRAMSKTNPPHFWTSCGSPRGSSMTPRLLRGTFLELEAFAAEILEAYDFGGILRGRKYLTNTRPGKHREPIGKP